MPRRHHYPIGISFFIILQLMFSVGATPTPFPSPTLTPFSQVQRWSEPVQLSAKGGNSWFPDIVADSTGQVHVVWSSGDPGYDSVYYTSSLDGIEWKKVNDIMALEEKNGAQAVTRPSLVMSSDGYLNMSFRDEQSLYFSRSNIETADHATSWSRPVILNGAQSTYFTRMVEDKNKVLHYFFSQNVLTSDCSQCYHLFHRSSIDSGATWSDPQDISLETIGTAKPQVVLDEKGGIHVVWEAGMGGGLGQLTDPTSVKYTNSDDGGDTWSSPQTLSPDTETVAKHITIGEDKNGNLIVVWLGLPENIVYYQTSDDSGKSWTSPMGIPLIKGSWGLYVSRLDDYQMVPDSQGDLHLVLVGQLATEVDSLNVFHLIWDGTNWSKPDSVVKMSGDVPEWPRIAVSNGNVLNVVWFKRDKATIFRSDAAHYTVWYSRAVLSDVQAVATVIPTYQPTSTPTPGSRTSMTPTVTPKPSLTIQPINQNPSDAKSSEIDYLGLLAKAILPSILIIGLVALIMIIRNR